jgi:hypothetical protein
MAVDLNLIGPRYNIITLIFFIPYVLCQPPATVILRQIGPRYFLSGITILWGATMVVSHFVLNAWGNGCSDDISGFWFHSNLD